MSPQNSEREIADLETEIASVRKLLQHAELQAEGGHFGSMKAISRAFGGAKPGDLSAMAEGQRLAIDLRRKLRELESRKQQLKETNPAVVDDKREKEIGLELWNNGSTWRQVNAKLGRPNTISEIKATTEEIRRFAKATKQEIRQGQAGAKKKS